MEMLPWQCGLVLSDKIRKVEFRGVRMGCDVFFDRTIGAVLASKNEKTSMYDCAGVRPERTFCENRRRLD